MNSKLQVVLPIAIIPNHSHAYVNENIDSKAIKEMFARNVEGYNKRFGTRIDPFENCVELWYGTEEESFQNGGLPEVWNKLFPYDKTDVIEERGYTFDRYGNRTDILPHLMPAKLFEGKKEGDRVILFDSNTVVVFGILRQRENRYGTYGTFEEVFNKVTR